MSAAPESEPDARGLREDVEALADLGVREQWPPDEWRAGLRALLAEHTPEAAPTAGDGCPKPWCAYPMPHDHTDGSGPTFDTLLSDPTQQLDGEGVVLASVLAHQAEPRRLTTAEREWLDDSMMHGFDALVHTVQRLMARAADEVRPTLAEHTPEANPTAGERVSHRTFTFGQSSADGDACRDCSWQGPVGSGQSHTRATAPSEPDAGDAHARTSDSSGIDVAPDARDVEALTGRDLIDNERARQQAQGYSVHHDREHGPYALYRAANCYAYGDPQGWPWSVDEWKPRDVLSNLVRAGALFQAALSVADPAMDDRTGWVGEKPKHIRRRRDEVAAQIDDLLASPVLTRLLAATADRARREDAVEAAGLLSDDEANQVDFEMGEHMYRHSISNNIGYMGCDVGCRTGALKRAIDKVLAARIARSTS